MKTLIAVLLGILVVLVFALFTGWIVMLCWNATMPMLFGLSTITYWQGYCLAVLGNVLFKSSTSYNNSFLDKK